MKFTHSLYKLSWDGIVHLKNLDCYYYYMKIYVIFIFIIIIYFFICFIFKHVPYLVKLDQISKQCAHQGSQVSSLGRLNLTYTSLDLN